MKNKSKNIRGKTSAFRDLVIISIIVIVVFVLSYIFDAFGRFINWHQQYGRYRGERIEEVIFLLIILAVAFSIFSFRRWREVKDELTVRNRGEELILFQQNLALELATVSSLDEALLQCLETALNVSKMDCGGIYLVDRVSGNLNLACKRGFSDSFIEMVSHWKAGSDRWHLVMAGKPIYTRHQTTGLSSEDRFRAEGLRTIAIIPVFERGRVIACFNIASHTLDEVQISHRNVLEMIAAQIGNVIGRLQTEEALRENEKKYRTILENIEDSYYEVDLAGNLTFFNDSLCRMLGYSKEELMGMNNRELTDLWNSKKLDQEFNKVYRTGEPSKVFDWEIIRKDGTKRNVEASVSFIKDSGSHPIGFRSVVRDITERKQAEEALHTEKQRFQTLTENAPFGMVMIDQDGIFRYINPKCRELLGYDLNDVPDGKTWFRKAYPDPAYRHQVISDWMNDLKSYRPGEKRPQTFRVIGKDGTEKIINFILIQLETGENLVALEDITESKRAEEALRVSEERFKDLFGDAPVGYHEVNLEGNVTQVNRTELQMLGYPLEEMLGHPIWKFLEEEDKVRRAFLDKMAGFIPPGRAFERTYRRKDGTMLSVLSEDRILLDSDGKVIGIRTTIQDITERKRAEEEQRQRERLQSILEMAGTVCHEMNQPMQIISGYSELLLTNTSEDDPIYEKLDAIKKQIHRMGTITRKLMTIKDYETQDYLGFNRIIDIYKEWDKDAK